MSGTSEKVAVEQRSAAGAVGRLVGWCTHHPWLVIAAAVAVGLAGDLGRRRLTGDVIPELAEPQIGIVADWMGHPAPAVASAITNVLGAGLGTVPGVEAVRGSSMSGMAYVDVVFASSSGLDAARQAVAAQVEALRPKLPANVRLYVGPAASSTGWVFEYALTDQQLVSSPLLLRRFQEDVLRPALAKIPGVAEVASVGGGVQQVRVDVRPVELRARGLAFSDVLAALRPVFAAAGGVARLGPEDLAAVRVRGPNAAAAAGGDAAPRLKDLGLVRVVDEMPTGAADVAGVEAVGGIVIARRDADLAKLVDEVKKTIARESRKLPHRDADPERLDSGAAADVRVVTTYDRADLATRVRRTLLRALGEEVGVVVLVLLLFLLHARSALLPLATLPLVLLMTFGAMWLLGVPATVMSLGGIGIALGMAVDADIVALEASHRQRERGEPLNAQSFAPAILTSLLITALSFLPVFAFSGETGRLLRPLALTKTLVVIAAAIVTLTLAPALRALLLRGRVIPELANPLTRNLVRLYRPVVHFALSRPGLTLATAGLALLSCLPIVTRLGGEFMPRIDEGDLLYMPTTLPGVPQDQAMVQMFWQDHAMSRFPEVQSVFGKVGRADTGTDPAPYSMAETTIRLRPRAEWPQVPRTRWYSRWAPEPVKALLRPFWPDATPRTQAELVAALDEAVRLPGWTSAWTAPARARMDMMATGVRTPVGVRIVSPDPQRLDAVGTAVRGVVARLPGTRSAVFEALGGETWLTYAPDEAALARQRVDALSARSIVDLVASGGQVGEIEHEGRRMRVKLAAQVPDVEARGAPDVVREITVRAAPAADGRPGAPVPLGLVGHPSYVRRPAALRTEKGELVAYVYVDLADGTDVQGFVERARRAVDAAVASGEARLLPGERIEWTGQYDLLRAGKKRLAWIVPLVALSMLGLLYLQFRNLTEALLVLASVPFALVGSFWTLYLLGYPLSAPVWVGLLSVVGLAMQTGVIMVVYIDEAYHRRVREGRLRTREDIVAAHAEGTVQRLRPKVMTIATMGASLLPLLWADGAGAEIMRRVAAPMLGGLLTSAFLTLEVIPVLYTIWRAHQLARGQAQAAAVVAVPAVPAAVATAVASVPPASPAGPFPRATA